MHFLLLNILCQSQELSTSRESGLKDHNMDKRMQIYGRNCFHFGYGSSSPISRIGRFLTHNANLSLSKKSP